MVRDPDENENAVDALAGVLRAQGFEVAEAVRPGVDGPLVNDSLELHLVIPGPWAERSRQVRKDDKLPPLLVLALDARQFAEFVRADPRAKGRKAIYASGADRIRGFNVRQEDVVVLDGFFQRDDAAMIHRNARFCARL